MILTGIALPSVTGIDWIAGLPMIFDFDPRDGLSFTGQRSPSPLHGDVSEEHALAGQIAKKHDVVVVGDVVSSVQISHSQNLQSKPSSQDQVRIGVFQNVGIFFQNIGKEV